MEIEVEDNERDSKNIKTIKITVKTAKMRKQLVQIKFQLKLKCLKEDTLDILLNLFNEVYTTGHVPKQWLVFTFVLSQKSLKTAVNNILHSRYFLK